MTNLPDHTVRPLLTLGDPGDGGYRPVLVAPPGSYELRRDLGGTAPSVRTVPLLSFVHVSDLHVTDVQSPSRVEYLDRLGEYESPVYATVGRVGTYRPHDILTHQVVEAMARTVRELDRGPVLGGPVTFVVLTGDAADNAQHNEVNASVDLLAGGTIVTPDSGDLGRYEGVGDPHFFDRHYWHPDGSQIGVVDDFPRKRWGYPAVPGLLNAARRPFKASGFGHPWFPVVGNHDLLLAGTVPPSARLDRVSAGRRKLGALPKTDWMELAQALHDHALRPPEVFSRLARGPFHLVTPDAGRRFINAPAWRTSHPALGAREHNYYSFEHGPLTFVMLDTVNPEGGWQGSLDAEQVLWLEETLQAGSSRWTGHDGTQYRTDELGRIFVLCSHHPLETLVNPWSVNGTRRVLAPELSELLRRFPGVVAWFNGHTHRHRVAPVCVGAGNNGGFWQITTASHIDWPQQSRVVEIGLDVASAQLVIATTTVDHSGRVDPSRGSLDEIETLAGWSRELAANHWPYRDVIAAAGLHNRHGNVVAVLPLPSHLFDSFR